MTAQINIGIAGLGTVGGGVVKILQSQADLLTRRTGKKLVVTGVAARKRDKDRGLDLSGVEWFEDPLALAKSSKIDVLVEVIGGSEGPARHACEAALMLGKPVVTANKALVAHHGGLLAQLAEEKKTPFAFEAAVAGGIPIIKMLREGLAANAFSRVVGILNGTCNYILTSMESSGASFDDALRAAQEKGYAEADSTFDIDGLDTAHKLAIVAALAFGMLPDLNDLHVEGIRTVSAEDVKYAAELGYRIKLLGICAKTDKGIEQRVHPALVPRHAPIAEVDGVFNALQVDGDAVGSVFIEGRGAGEGPTASAVVADLIDIARGTYLNPFILPAASLGKAKIVPMKEMTMPYYLRLKVEDQAGVLADIASAFRDAGVSVSSLIQHGYQTYEPVDIVIITHAAPEENMQRALERISTLGAVINAPNMLRIVL